MSLDAAQQGAPDQARTHLDVAWVGPRVGGGGVSGNPLGRATSVIQFDDVSAMVALCLHPGSLGGLNRGAMDKASISDQERALPPALLKTLSPCKSLVPLMQLTWH